MTKTNDGPAIAHGLSAEERVLVGEMILAVGETVITVAKATGKPPKVTAPLMRRALIGSLMAQIYAASDRGYATAHAMEAEAIHILRLAIAELPLLDKAAGSV